MKKYTSLLAVSAILSSFAGGVTAFAADQVPTEDTKTTDVKAIFELPEDGGSNPNIPDDPDEETNTNNDPKAAFAIAYQPTLFDFGTNKLQESGEQVIKSVNDTTVPYHVGVKDKRRMAEGWTLTAQLAWTGDNASQMDGTKIHVGSTEVKKNVNGEVEGNVNPDGVTGVNSFDITKDAVTVMSADATQRNDVYDEKLSDVTLVIPEAKNVSAGTYNGTVTWHLASTPK